jgi:hypothetical protein
MYKQTDGTFTRTLEPGISFGIQFKDGLVTLMIIDDETHPKAMSKLTMTREQFDLALPLVEWSAQQSMEFVLDDPAALGQAEESAQQGLDELVERISNDLDCLTGDVERLTGKVENMEAEHYE